MLYTARSRYSTYVVNDMDKSATPAVAFSLLVENTGTKATDVDFVFTLPFSVEPESARPEGGPVRKKRLFWRHVILKTMNLPRQARDRHRKSGEKEAFSCRTLVPRRHHRTHLRRRRQRNVSHSASHAITVVVSHLYTNAVFLPRQARDKHRESTQKRLCFSAGASRLQAAPAGRSTAAAAARWHPQCLTIVTPPARTPVSRGNLRWISSRAGATKVPSASPSTVPAPAPRRCNAVVFGRSCHSLIKTAG